MTRITAAIIGWALLGYLYFHFWDTFAQTYSHQPGQASKCPLTTGTKNGSFTLEVLIKGSLAFNFWFVEILFGIIVPAILLLNSRFRKNSTLRMLALAMVVLGVIAYRWDTNLVGQLVVLTYLPQEIVARYTSCTPTLIEFIAGAGVIAYGMFAFTMGVRFLDVVDHHVKHKPVVSTERKPTTLPEAVATD